jgi:hypothetical protein
MKLVTHDYNDIKELTTEELKMLISEIIDIDETPSALRELNKRDPISAIAFGKNILENSLGDVYLQAAVFDYIFGCDKQYITDYISKYLDKMELYVFANMVNRLAEESDQPYGRNISGRLLNRIVNRHMLYNGNQKNKIADKFQLFLVAYDRKIKESSSL